VHRGDEAPNLLRFGLDPENVSLELTGTGPRPQALSPMSLTAELESPELPAYGQLLHSVLAQLHSQRLRLINHQGDALRLGMNWTEEDLGKPRALVDSEGAVDALSDQSTS
jgi:hypothetical protein